MSNQGVVPGVATSGSERAFIAPLTSMRLFAAVAVVIYHSGKSAVLASSFVPNFVKTISSNGYLGVSFFFVLSGFILGFVYGNRVDSLYAYRQFLEARFARIYPVYLFAVILMAPFQFQLSLSALPQFFLVQMWIFGSDVKFQNWNGPAWTLSVELLFYLVYPLVGGFLWKLKAKETWIVVLLIAGSILVLRTPSVWALPRPGSILYGVPLPLIRLPEFMLGVALARLATLQRHALPFIWGPAMSLLALVCILSASATPAIAGPVCLACAALVYTTARAEGGLIVKVLSWRWLVIGGAASYALYLLQQPVHFWSMAVLGEGRLGKVLQFPILAIAAVATFYLIEERARERLRRYWGMRRSIIGKEVATTDAS